MDRIGGSLRGLDPGNKVGVAGLSIHTNGLLPLSWHCCGLGHCHGGTKHSAFPNLVLHDIFLPSTFSVFEYTFLSPLLYLLEENRHKSHHKYPKKLLLRASSHSFQIEISLVLGSWGDTIPSTVVLILDHNSRPMFHRRLCTFKKIRISLSHLCKVPTAINACLFLVFSHFFGYPFCTNFSVSQRLDNAMGTSKAYFEFF